MDDFKLTAEQEKFVEKYLETLDLSPEERLELLYNPRIAEEIYARLDYYASLLKITKAFVIQKLLDIALYASEREDVLDKEARPTGKKKMRDPSIAIKAIEALSKYSSSSTTASKGEGDTEIGFGANIIENLDENKL